MTEIMSTKDKDVLSDLLECSICMEAFQTSGSMRPKMLRCQHSFCIICLQKMKSGFNIQCPICRMKFEASVNELPNNLLLMRIIDSKGPVGPNVDDKTDSPEIPPPQQGSNVTNLCKYYKTPSKARAALQQFKEAQSDMEFDGGHLSAILKCMEYYEQVGDSEHLDIITVCLQLVRNSVQKAGGNLLLFPKLTQRVIEGVVAVLNSFKRRTPIQVHSIHVLRYLGVPRVLGEKMLDVAKVILQCLNVNLGQTEESKVIEMMNIIPRELSREDNAAIGSQANVKSVLLILEKKLSTPTRVTTLSSLLSALMCLTDETPTTCVHIVDEKGLDILEKLLKDLKIALEPKSDALIVLSNLAKVPDVRKEIIKHRSIIEVLKELMMSQNRRVSFMSASVIAHLSVVPQREWTRLCGVSDFREDVLQKLYVQVSAWESASCTNVKFRSFKPFYPLLQMFSSPPTQLFAAWTIRSFCQLDKTTYQEMLIKEDALELLLEIKENNYADANVRKFVGDILDSIH